MNRGGIFAVGAAGAFAVVCCALGPAIVLAAISGAVVGSWLGPVVAAVVVVAIIGVALIRRRRAGAACAAPITRDDDADPQP